MIRASLLAAVGIRVASASELRVDPHKDTRYSGVPAIPSDMTYVVGKRNTESTKKPGIFMQIMSHNPFVILGCGLTTAALIGMIFKSFKGDKVGAQKMMQYRIAAQFFTVFALVAGVTLFATYTPSKSNGEKN